MGDPDHWVVVGLDNGGTTNNATVLDRAGPGAEVLMQYPFGPTIGAGVNVTLMSYVDTCALGINVDTGAVPDFAAFHDCLVAGFDEVLELAAVEPVR